MNIVVISDIHANQFALAAVIEGLAQHEFDSIIVQGDLLTYGCAPNEVIKQLIELNETYNNVEFLIGNHDELYFPSNLHSDDVSHVGFIHESIEWTKKMLKYDLFSMFKWKYETIVGNLFISHANPFAKDDWSYLNKDSLLIRAAGVLSALNCNAGLFGHIHRGNKFIINNDEVFVKNSSQISSHHNGVLVATNYSVGQPRGGKAGFVIAKIDDNSVTLNFHTIEYNVKEHVNSIFESNMSDSTKNKLASFFES